MDTNQETATQTYVTRAGAKLHAALLHFDIRPDNYICLDLGSAEGGFVDCLLQWGAGRVYAVDVAYGIFDWKLRHDERVVLLERTNARYLDSGKIPETVDLISCDVSFISLKKILPVAAQFLKANGHFLCLYKPQFELPRKHTGRHGIPINDAVINTGIAEMTAFLADESLFVRAVYPSPIKGKKGNTEYFLYGDIAVEAIPDLR